VEQKTISNSNYMFVLDAHSMIHHISPERDNALNTLSLHLTQMSCIKERKKRKEKKIILFPKALLGLHT